MIVYTSGCFEELGRTTVKSFVSEVHSALTKQAVTAQATRPERADQGDWIE